MCARGRIKECRNLISVPKNKKSKEAGKTKSNTGKKCGGCKVVMYCCPEHQKADWPLHKSTCKKLKKLKALRQVEKEKAAIVNANDTYLHTIPSEKEVEMKTECVSVSDPCYPEKPEYIAALHLFLKGGVPIQCFSCGKHTTGVRACEKCDSAFFCKNRCATSTIEYPSKHLCENQTKWLWDDGAHTNKKCVK